MCAASTYPAGAVVTIFSFANGLTSSHDAAYPSYHHRSRRGPSSPQASELFPEIDSKAGGVDYLASTARINSFEHAVPVFRRATAAVLRAMKHYVLDGFVTEHVHLVQLNSRLYKHVSRMESNVSAAREDWPRCNFTAPDRPWTRQMPNAKRRMPRRPREE